MDGKLRQTPSRSAAKSGAVETNATPIDADLARVMAAWPALPEPIRRAVLALIDAGAGDSESR
jgi:hypothetical protein